MITAAVYLGTLRAHWRKLVALAALGLVVGLLGSRVATTQYTCNRLLVVTAQGGQSLTDLSQGGSVATSRAQALAYIGNTGSTLYESLSALGVDPARAADFRISTGVPANTTFVEVNTQAPTEQLAVGMAQAAAERLIRDNAVLASTLTDSSKAAVIIRDVTPVSVQNQAWPIGLSKWLLPAAGTLLLPMLAYLLLVFRSAVKPTVGESLDLDEIVPFPVLGSIERVSGQQMEVVRPLPEDFTVLGRSGLMEPVVGGRVVALIGVEGPSDCRPALGLAQALAQLGRRVLVVDANLKSPSLDRPIGGGLAQCLETQTDFPDGQRLWLDTSVSVLPTAQSADATRLLVSPHAHHIIDKLRGAYDVVIVSSASALEGPDASAVADLSDEVILMAETSTHVDRIVDAGHRFREGSISGLLILQRGRSRSLLSGKDRDTIAAAKAG